MRPTNPLNQQPEGYSIIAMSRLLHMTRETIRRHVASLTPCGQRDGNPLYRLEDMEQLMAKKPDKSLRDEKLQEEIRKLRLRNDRDERKVVLRADIAARLFQYVSAALAILDQKLLNEAPVALEGLCCEEIRLKLDAYIDDVRAELNKLKDTFPEDAEKLSNS